MGKKIKELLNKGRGNTCPEAERKEMLGLFHDSSKEYAVKKQLLKNLHAVEPDDSNHPNYKWMFSNIWRKIEKKNASTGTRYLNSFAKIAAALILGLVIGTYVTSIKKTNEPLYYAAHSPEGSVSDILLPDGSVIFLNAESRIKYSIDGEQGIREVFLDGEAWFDVAENRERPFVVHTSFYDINVTGTKFNVKAYNDDSKVCTTLEEGEVVISSSEKLKVENEVVLKPGEQISFDKSTRTINVKKVNTQRFTSWKDNKLVFVNMHLKEFIVILERKYGVDMEIKNKKILDLHIDCTIKDESIIEILDYLKKTLSISYEMEGQKIIINSN